MARALGPSAATRYCYDQVTGAPAANRTAVIYADAAGTVPADIRSYDGSTAPGPAVGGSIVPTDTVGQLSLIWFPDRVRRLWARVGNGPIFPIDADPTGLIESLDVGHNPALRRWYAALAGRYGSIASVVVMGDSISEGYGATSVTRRWLQVLQSELRSRFQPAGVAGAAYPYISASPRVSPIPADYPRTATAGVTQSDHGLGLRSAVIPAGESVTFSFTGSRAKVYGTKGAAVGKYGIRLDGAAEVVVDGAAASTSSGVLLWDSGALTAGAHTVLVQRSSTTTASPGNVLLEGLVTYHGDESGGVRVLDASRSGATLATFTGSNLWHGALGAVEGKGLLVLAWGANDSTTGTTPAAFKAGLELLIANARTAGWTGSILLLKLPKRGSAAEVTWLAYLAQMDAIAAADPDITTLDLRSRIPDQGTAEATALGLYVDEAHNTDKGQGLIADHIATAVVTR
ncbi:SGNH/GDSL hydrolase family protein [Micromonospora tarensis]|uniref:SGNH/GDSL hydrolase family protein n=1 Tax=Micromonospora tarensis TaxID=2806100 RepID=A0ABS1Y9W7_9ACTN|nr:SGNH/GDSL hydrolase family protein [Micromonospora tarensis]MBM0274137.1 SGNH/GDSL hydrolase family protein [Micromonospora tarensis]